MFIILFVLGLIFGSFGSVLLTRFDNIENISDFFHKFKSFLIGRSKCPQCKKKLKIINLIPLFSFLLQRGKCSQCKSKISTFYPKLEIMSGLFFVFFPYLYSLSIGLNLENIIFEFNFIFFFIINWLLLLLMARDQKTMFLHFAIRILTFVMSVIFSLFNFPIQIILINFVLFLVVFLLIFLFGKRRVKKRLGIKGEGIGEGDVWLTAIIGIIFPMVYQINLLEISYLNFFYCFVVWITVSCLVGIFLVILEYFFGKLKKKNLTKSTSVPFFPGLILGFWIMLFFSKYFL